MIKRKNARFIPSQRIKGSDKELFIINYEGSVIEVQRTSNLYEPLIVRLNGELLETVPSKQNKEIEFSTADGKHKLQVWNERVENTLIPKIFVKDGIALVIDGVPVQNSLADPMSRLSSGKAVIWLLTILLFLKAFLIPLSFIQEFKDTQNLAILFVYIILFILSLSAALTFQLNPLRSTWIALAICIIELAEFIYSITLTRDFSFLTFLFLGLRIGILGWLIFSIRNLKHILNLDKDIIPLSKPADMPEVKRTKKKFSFRLKYVAIFFIAIAIIAGIYYGVTEIITASKTPSIERDSSLEFRTKLKLPDLIPYRKGDKWGYANIKGEIVIKPGNSRVEFFSENKFLRVEKDTLVGIIDNQGNELIPCVYKDIDELLKDNLFIVKNIREEVGIIDEKNNIVIPFDYEQLEKHSSRDLYIAQKGKIGVIDGNHTTIIPFIYENQIIIDPSEPALSSVAGLELCNNFIIARKKINDKLYSAIFNIDGSILLNFVDAIIARELSYILNVGTMDGRNLEDDLVLVSIEKQDIYNPRSGQFEPARFIGIIDKTGKIVLPIEYRSISPYYSSSKKYSTIDKINYRTDSYVNGLINSKGEIVIPCEYYQIEDYRVDNYDEYILIKYKSLYGLLDSNNKIIFEPNYKNIWVQKHNEDFFFAVTDKYKNKTGLLKKSNRIIENEVVIPFDYDRIIISEKDFDWIRVIQKGRCGIINFENKFIVPTEYIHIGDMVDGLAKVKFVEQDSINFIINSKNIKANYYLEEIHNGLKTGWHIYALIQRNPDYKYADYTLFELSNALSDTAVRRQYYEDNAKYLTRFCQNYEIFVLSVIFDDYVDELPGKWGYFNDKGELVIDFIYDDAESFDDGYAEVKYKEKWGVMKLNKYRYQKEQHI